VELKRIDAKLFVADPDALRWEPFTAIFTRWLQENRDEWLDIAGYRHVPAGPGILLVGKNAHVSMDDRESRPGLVYSRREPLPGDNVERLTALLVGALDFARKMEEEPEAGVRFRTDLLEVVVNDRVDFPNTEEVFAELEPQLRQALKHLYGGAAVQLDRNTDPGARLTVRVRVSESRSVAQLLDDLAVRV
jgi:hypothetical protein